MTQSDTTHRLTEPQRRVLEQAVADGGAITIGGSDSRKARRDVLIRLWNAGYLRLGNGTFMSDDWKITAAGKLALKAQP